MSRYVFNITERGFLHIKKDIPCEDSSGSFEDNDGEYTIAVVADGHGDPACFRAEKGSKFAVTACVESLKEFAEAIKEKKQDSSTSAFLEKLAYEKSSESVLRQLTNSIISRWGNLVSEDLVSNPCTDEEYEIAGAMGEIYRKGEKLLHIYGTTLIAALLVCDYLILIQQGDGRCDVFYEDGTVDQPIPWDDRCFENVTTSMCDSDVVTSIRHCVIPIDRKRVIACFLTSDGVEDSFVNEPMDGVHTFNRGLCGLYFTVGRDHFLEELHSRLPDFSENGSGDDISIAGIFDIEKIELLLPFYAELNRRYELIDKRVALENKVHSMTRKHGILLQESENTKQLLERKKAEIDTLEQHLAELKGIGEKINIEMEEIILEIEESNRIQKESQTSIDSRAERVIKKIVEGYKSLQDLRVLQHKLAQNRSQIVDAEKELAKAYQEMNHLAESERKLSAEFEAYDIKFRAIERELAEVTSIINEDLSGHESEVCGIGEDGK